MTRIIAFNKPYGVLCQFTGEAGQRTLAEFGLPPGVYAAGRLDRDSEGLLILSDDGRFIDRLIHPRHGHPRTYWAQLENIPGDDALEALRRGVRYGDVRTRPCLAERLDGEPPLPPRNPPVRYRKSIPTAWIALTLTEGKNRQVRRMTAAIGHPTLRLVRVAVGKLALGDLPPGAWRDAAEAEILDATAPPSRKSGSGRPAFPARPATGPGPAARSSGSAR